MSSSNTTPDAESTMDTDAETAIDDRDLSMGELAVLREENKRLRDEYRRARQQQHRQSAFALAGIGGLAGIGAVVLPGVRELLVVLCAIGVFGAVLTYYLTPERITTASVVDSVHRAHAQTVSGLIEELGLQDTHIYLPATTPGESGRLFVPQQSNYTLPEDHDRVFTVQEEGESRGVCLPTIGGELYDALEPATPEVATADDALSLATDSVVEQFELAASAEYDLGDTRATVTVDDVRPHDLTTADHPVRSLCGIVLATTLETPVTVSAADTTQITFTWEPTGENAGSESQD